MHQCSKPEHLAEVDENKGRKIETEKQKHRKTKTEIVIKTVIQKDIIYCVFDLQINCHKIRSQAKASFNEHSNRSFIQRGQPVLPSLMWIERQGENKSF